MSSSDEEESEDIVSTTNFVASTKSYTKLPKPSDSQQIIINVHSTAIPVQKADKFIQTEHALKAISVGDETPVIKDLSSRAFQEKRESTSKLREPPGRKVERSFSSIYKKKFFRLLSSESFEENPMESRKQNVDRHNKPPSNKQSDLERRRLEAELKAVEEIAKLRQIIIEKRLALELATIDDAAELQNRSFVNHNSLQAELRALEEIALRKQSLIETNLAQEFESLDYQRCRSSSSPPPPPPPSPPPPPLASHYLPTPFQYSPTPKQDPCKTESSTSIVNPLRGGIGYLEKKLNLDRKFSYDSGQRTPVSTPTPIPPPTAYPQQYTDPRMRKDDGYNTTTADAAYQYQGAQEYGKTHSTWRSAVAKIRSKIRSRGIDGSNDQ